MLEKHKKASSRPDLSPVLVHFTKDPKIVNERNIHPFDVLRNILKKGRVLASEAPQVTYYDEEGVGASCFYEVPPKIWEELIDTSPKHLRGCGIIIWKVVFWHLGGRPAIYTENPEQEWPEKEKYRLIKTDMCRQPDPLDWTHEREWRFRGDFDIYRSKISKKRFLEYKDSWDWQYYDWWWPCVETTYDAWRICREFNNVKQIYVMETQHFFEC